MPQLKWVANTGDICETEAEAIELEQRDFDLSSVENFVEQNPEFGGLCFHLAETLTGVEFLKACLRIASKTNPYLTEVFGDGFKESLIHFLK